MIGSLKRYAFRKFRQSETKLHELNYLFWECTTRCNLNCIHCGSDCSKDSAYKDMPIDDFLAAVDTVPHKPHNFTVVFTGGEPLVRNDIEQCGRELRKRGVRWSLVSNGHLYDEKRHVSLLNAGLGALTISLDGLEQSHNWLRNHPRSFEKVMTAIELAASSQRLNFDVVTCVNQLNISELTDLKRLLIAKGVKAWRLFTIIPIGRATNHPQLMLSDHQFVGLMEFIKESRKIGEIDIKFSCEGYVGSYERYVRDSYFFCRAGINIGSVLIDGSISACPNTDRSFAQGNIYTDNLEEVWQNRFQPFRNRAWTKTGQCAHCGAYNDCLGNGLHNWHGNKSNVLVCHHQKLQNRG
jgi:radical SAM enzyme (rSAM/lipoprotein system)